MPRGVNLIMGNRNIRFLIPILIIVAFAVWVVLPNNPGIHLGSFNRDIRIVRGLDLQGGLQVLLEADLPPEVEVTSEQIQTARDIVEKRVNGLGVSESLVQVAGSRRILVELPGIGDTEKAVETIKETGLLEFVEMSVEDLNLIIPGQPLTTDFGMDLIAPTATPTAEPTASPDQDGETWSTPVAVEERPQEPEPIVFHTVMTGADLKSAAVTRDQVGEYMVSFELTDEGRRIFGEYTSTHVGGLLGIVLDRQVISAPRINEPITQGTGVISGNFTADEANALAIQLRYGSLPIPLTVAESKSVGPTLGQDSLEKSTLAGIVGLTVVMLFMALYYRLPGILADLALLVYAVITFALFKLIPVTLTLPGIAGFVLSVGVAVDANVLIFERMKEELRGGRTLSQAIEMGFSRAWPSIRDSNLSTLITCAILYWFGNTFGASIVKGFSLTLALGVMVSLFTAITVTRTFLHLVLDNIRLADHPRWFGI